MGKKEFRKKIVFVIAFSAVCVLLLLIAEHNKTTTDYWGFAQNMGVSIVCSIIASGIYSLLQTSSDTEARQSEITEIEKIKNEIEEVNLKLRIKNDLYDSGIVSIRKKSYYEDEGKFWRDIVNSTSDRLDLIGHAISHWFKPEYRDIFIKKVTEMLRTGKTVRIVLSGPEPDMQMIHKIEEAGKETSKCKFQNKMDRTCWELRAMAGQVPQSKRENLHVYVAHPDQVTYMYIRTDNQCFISPYITSNNHDANTFLLELKTRIEYSKCFDEDFSELLKSGLYELDLEG